MFGKNNSAASEVDLIETVLSTVPVANIDEENGIIKGVRIIGRTGKNRDYSEKAIKQAIPLYEGCEVNVDHPERSNVARERTMGEGWGVLKEITESAGGDGAVGNLHYLKSHAATPVIIERIRRGFPIGLSHNARGVESRKNGKAMVESVNTVRSVDLVRKPATNANLFESEDVALSEAVKNDAFKPYTGLVELTEDYGDAMVAPAAGGSEASIKAAFRTACNAVLDDDSLDVAAAIKKLRELMKSEDKVMAASTTTTNTTESVETATKPLLEAIEKLTAKVDLLESSTATTKKVIAVDTVLSKHGMTRASVGVERVKLLESQQDDTAIEQIVAGFPPSCKGNGKPPAAQVQDLAESQGGTRRSTASIRSMLTR